jgi:hypothetical protein
LAGAVVPFAAHVDPGRGWLGIVESVVWLLHAEIGLRAF